MQIHDRKQAIVHDKDVHYLSRDAIFVEIWHNALLPYLATRLSLIVVGLLANFYVLPLTINYQQLYAPFPQVFWQMWERFDSGFYLWIAHAGYGPAGNALWVFHPLYPLTILAVGTLFGGSNTALSLAGLLISNVSSAIAVIYLYLLVRRELNRVIASRTVLYLALFPMSFYLSAVYTEGLFLLLAIACIYYARKQSWWAAGLCGGLATLCRDQGIMLLVPLTWEYFRVLSDRYMPLPAQLPLDLGERIQLRLRYYLRGLLRAGCELKNWWTGVSLALIPTGLSAFMLFSWSQTGDFLTIFEVNRVVWGRQLSPPWRLLIYSLRHPILGEPSYWNFWLINIIAALTFLGLTVVAFRRLPIIYALYSAVMVLLPLSSNQLDSTARYYIVVFPVFILLALFSREEKPNRHTFILVSFAMLQAFLMVAFIIGMHAVA